MEDVEQQLHFVRNRTSLVLREYDQKEVSLKQKFCLDLFQRLNLASSSILALLSSNHHFDEIDFGIGIILRSQILDYLIVMDGHMRLMPGGRPSVTEETIAAFESYCEKILFDDANQSAHRFIKDAISVGFLQGEKAAELKNKFDISDGNMVSASSIHRRIGQGEMRAHVQGIRDLYETYSKYDHFNAWSTELLQPTNRASKQDSVRSGVYAMLTSFMLLVDTMVHFPIDGFLINQYGDWLEYFVEEGKRMRTLQNREGQEE